MKSTSHKKIKWLYYIIVLLFISIHLQSQDSTKYFYEQNKVGVTLSSLINNYQAVQLNFAKGISQNMDINAEIGIILKADNRKESQGFRLRIQPRFNFNNNPQKYKLYFSPLLQYRYTNSQVENIFSRYNGAYFQQITHREVNNMWSLGMMLGTFIKIDENLFFNWGIGLGLNFANIHFPDVPEDAVWKAEFQDLFFLSDSAYDYKDEGNYTSILFIYHFNIFHSF